MVENYAPLSIGLFLDLGEQLSDCAQGIGRREREKRKRGLFPLLEHLDLANERVTCGLAGILHVLQCEMVPPLG